jgi:hypothetical protein
VLQQALANIARRHPDYRIIGRVVRRVASEQRNPDAAFAKVRGIAMERAIHDVLEKSLAAVAALESRTLYDLLDVLPELGLVFCGRAHPGDGGGVSGAIDFTGHRFYQGENITVFGQ